MAMWERSLTALKISKRASRYCYSTEQDENGSDVTRPMRFPRSPLQYETLQRCHDSVATQQKSFYLSQQRNLKARFTTWTSRYFSSFLLHDCEPAAETRTQSSAAPITSKLRPTTKVQHRRSRARIGYSCTQHPHMCPNNGPAILQHAAMLPYHGAYTSLSHAFARCTTLASMSCRSL